MEKALKYRILCYEDIYFLLRNKEEVYFLFRTVYLPDGSLQIHTNPSYVRLSLPRINTFLSFAEG